MALPKITITILNGQLMAVSVSDDSIMGMVLFSDTAPSGLALGTPKAIFSLKEAEALGITESFDTTNSVDLYYQIKGFYTRARTGTELWIMVVAQTTTMTGAADKTADIVKKLLRSSGAKGRVKMWGMNRIPDGAYTATYDDGIDDDVSGAVTKAHELNLEQESLFQPCLAVIGARDFQGDVGDLKDFSQNTTRTCQVMLGSTVASGIPAVGFTLGQYANRPVQRKISRVKDGDLSILDDQAYMSDGENVETYEDAWDTMDDKGYVFFRKVPEHSGYYFSRDIACVDQGDDYALFSRGRILHKMLRIVAKRFINELEDEIDIDESGYMDPTVIKSLQANIVNDLEVGMKGEINGARCVIKPDQRVNQTNKLAIEKVAVRVKGYSSWIEINIGFE